MKAVILAAGKGTRMRPLTESTPKALLKIGQETILDRQIRQLESAGVDAENIIIVIGHLAQSFRQKYSNSNIKLVENEKYSDTDNLFSFYQARKYVEGEDFLVLNGDAVFEFDLLTRTIDEEGSVYPIDFEKEDKESLKVSTKQGRVNDILPKESTDYDGVTTEVFKISAGDSKVLFEVAENIFEDDKTQWFDTAVKKSLDMIEVEAIDVSDLFWAEVDTPAELEELRNLLEGKER